MGNKNYHKQNLKEKIIKLVLQHIKNDGYQSISVRKLAKELEVSPTAIYRHYDNLNSIFNHASKLISQEFTDYLKCTYESNELSSTDELEIIGYRFINYAVSYKNEFDFLFLSEYSLKDVSLRTHNEIPLIVFMFSVIERLKISNSHIDKELLFNQLWCFIFGYAVLVSKKELQIDKKLIHSTIKSLVN